MKTIVNKPWGSFKIIDEGEKFTIKKIIVNPGGKLSLQRHEHRSEHWLIAEGKAEVIIDQKTYNLIENEHIFIPLGAKHRLTNNSSKNLVIVELWFGEHLDENDIIRCDDIYGRDL